MTLVKMAFGGDPTWSESGRVMEWNADGSMMSDSRKVGGKTFSTHYGWSGQTWSTTYKLDGAPYRTEELTFADKPLGSTDANFRNADFRVDGILRSTLRFHGPDDYFPYSVYAVDYVSGYRERSSRSASDIPLQDGTKRYRDITTVSSGWGGTPASLQLVETHTNRYGSLLVGPESSEGTYYDPSEGSYGPSQWIYGPGGVLLDRIVASNPAPNGAPQALTHLRGEVESISYEQDGLAAGLETSHEDVFGVSSGMSDFDWKMRPRNVDVGHLSYGVVWTDPHKPVLTGSDARTVSPTISPFGEVSSSSTNFADGGSFSLVPGGNSSVTVGTRSATMSMDHSGWVSSISNGLGQRGADFGFGVESGVFYTEVTERMNDGSTGAFPVKTHYYGDGRVKSISQRPHTGGGVIVTDSWVYDDVAGTVTYQPGVGPLAQGRMTRVSPAAGGNGTVRTVNELVGGTYQGIVRETVKGEGGVGGKVIKTLEIFNDSKGGARFWEEVSRTEAEPGAGTSVSTPWGVTENALTVTHSVPGTTSNVKVTGGATGENITVNLANGRPSAVVGSSVGLPINLSTFTYNAERLTGTGGTIGGKAVSATFDLNGRLTALTSPWSSKTLSYDIGQAGVTVTSTDSIQLTTNKVVLDATSDLKEIEGSGMFKLHLDLKDTATGSKMEIRTDANTSAETKLSVFANQHGVPVTKSYSGSITETYMLNLDGTLQNSAVAGGSGGPETQVGFQQTPTQSIATSSDGVITTNYYHVGLPKNVTAPNDGRSFEYERLEPAKETHTAGPWQGWEVKWISDTRGRLGTLNITDPSNAVRSFGFGYDDHSRLYQSSSSEITGTYTIRAFGASETLERRKDQDTFVTTTWGYDSLDRLASLTNDNTEGADFNYSFVDVNGGPLRDRRHRLTGKRATVGSDWTGLTYDDADQLRNFSAGGRQFSYGYDTRGNRASQLPHLVDSSNKLNQLHTRTAYNRTYGVFGSVTPAAAVKVFDPWNATGRTITVDSSSGIFSDTQPLPSDANPAAHRMEVSVRGTLQPTTPGGKAAVSEREFNLFVPPVQESVGYDGAGRLKTDALWDYGWDDFGRLKQMVRKPGLSNERGAISDIVDFVYDAGGRRTEKTRTLGFENNKMRVEKSRVLWAGWLPILEIRSRDGIEISRHWFQWGRDLSGTLEGAGGIGGLLAITEEKPMKPVRLLLPVQDGLGNVTAVLNAGDGTVVARYEYGPFGEPLGEYGETEVCPFRWQTKWCDTESEHYYFGYRYYSPRMGRWLSRDPLGESGGFNLYAYCGNDPVNRWDYLGLLSQRQIERVLKLLAEAPRGRVGSHGEKVLERLLRGSGRTILYGPLTTGKNVYEKGADIIAFNPHHKDGARIEIWDNKYLSQRENVSRAPTLTRPERRAANIQRATDLIEASSLSNRLDILRAMEAGNVDFLVGGAGVGNRAKDVTARLKQVGIRFGSESWIQKSGLGKRLAKGVPLFGTGIALMSHVHEAKAANAEDRFFREIVRELGQPGDHISWGEGSQSFITATAGIVGEETIGNVAGALGGGIGTLLGLGTGPGALLTGVGGSMILGATGDAAGKDLGISVSDWFFDEDE